MKLENSEILLTGATGFIGANLLRTLLKKNPKSIHVILRPSSNIWRIKDIINLKVIKTHYGNITNKKFLNKVFSTAEIDIVYHCATYGLVLNKHNNKEKILKTNIFSLFYLIQYAKEYKIKKFINTGTTSEYGIKNIPMKENMLLEPLNTYGASKAAATILASQLAKENNLNLITLRLFSPYGYYEEKNRLFPYLILKYLNNETIYLSSKYFVRDFTFIDDIITAYIRVSEDNKKYYGDIFNVGTGIQYRIIDVVNTLEKIGGEKSKIVWGKNLAKQKEPRVWKSDNSKIKKHFKWYPKYSLEVGLKKNLKWFKNNIKLYI